MKLPGRRLLVVVALLVAPSGAASESGAEPVLSAPPAIGEIVSGFGFKDGFLLADDEAALRAEADRVQLAPRPPQTGARTRPGRLLITALNVRDLATALRFFTEGLGMTEQGRHVPSKDVVEVTVGYTDNPLPAGLMLIHRQTRTAPYERGEWGRIILEVEDVNATAASAVRAGGKLVRPPGDVASAPVVVAVVEGPDGHHFELVQFKE